MKILLLLILTTGCSVRGVIVDKGAGAVAKGTLQYCNETTPDMRKIFRRKVNDSLKGRATIAVKCATVEPIEELIITR